MAETNKAPGAEPFLAGQRNYREGLRPSAQSELEDKAFMAGWFYEWGFNDRASTVYPLFTEEDGMAGAAYGSGYEAAGSYMAAVNSKQDAADEHLSMFAAHKKWDQAFIDRHLRAVEQLDCDETTVAFSFAQVSDEEPDGELVLRVVFRKEVTNHPDRPPTISFVFDHSLDLTGEEPKLFKRSSTVAAAPGSTPEKPLEASPAAN